MITPHHGTHWDESLKNLNSRWVASSEIEDIKRSHWKYKKHFGHHFVSGMRDEFNACLSYERGYQVPYSLLE